MIKANKITKLIDRLQQLIRLLEQHKELTIHQHVDQFYYMEKAEKFKALLDRIQQLNTQIELLKRNLCKDYVLTYEQWRKDFTWLVRYNNHQRPGKRSIL